MFLTPGFLCIHMVDVHTCPLPAAKLGSLFILSWFPAPKAGFFSCVAEVRSHGPSPLVKYAAHTASGAYPSIHDRQLPT